MAPTLETPRLTLRAHRVEDFDPLAAVWSDPIVVRYFGGYPLTREDSWARLLRYAGHWALLGFGFWAIEERVSGEYVGDIGFARLHREIEPPLPDVPEVGWALASRVHGKGYATEAVRAALEWGETRFAEAKTVCIIHPDNRPSLRVAAKCGFRECGRATYRGQPTLVFERYTTQES
ncbi:MAG TPA: GNAT family N-acetyltransferase [Candidatus Acidoferrales bacterium]|nr:GNAT family N-acetyltransferase [Candidatus Acidoferrales bacterium]